MQETIIDDIETFDPTLRFNIKTYMIANRSDQF